MDNVTVACSCGRKMVAVGNAPKGTFRCGCGARVAVTVADPPVRCAGISEDRRACLRPREVDTARTGLPLALCAEHGDLVAARFDEARTEGLTTYQKLVLYMARAREWDDLPEPPAPVATDDDPRSVVYYARFRDLIKIGTSVNYAWRLSVSELGADEVLATEPGGRLTEGKRHRQFADCRLAGPGERFFPSDELVAHIAALQGRNASASAGARLRGPARPAAPALPSPLSEDPIPPG